VHRLHRLAPNQLGQALRLVWESSPGWTIAGATLLVVQAGLGLAALVLIKLVVDTIATGLGSPDPAGTFRHVAILIGLAAGVALLSALGRSLETAVGEIQRELIRDHMHSLVHAKAVEVDLEYYESAEYYNALHRAQVEAPQRATTILTNLLQVGRGAVSLVAIAGLLIAFNWWVAVVLVIGDIPGALVRVRAAWELYHWQRERTSAEVRAQYYNAVLISPYFVQELRLFDLGRMFVERFRALRQQLRDERQQLVVRRLTAELAAQVSATVAMYGAYGFVAYQALAGAISLGDLVMYYAAFQRGQGHLQELLFGLGRSYEDNLFLSNLSEFLALDQTVADPAQPLPVPRPLRTGITLEHVDFRYPGAGRLALDDVSVTVQPGERIAIVGPNGSGKTTLVKLLCRLYDPTAGRITADGIPLRCFAKAAWRREISALVQEPGKYCLTARENIWLGTQEPLRDDEPIRVAAQRTGAHPVIERLPQGYDTVLGKLLDDGAELSVGEWQKIGLARTYLRDAQVVILDEPTSALDALAEQELLETFWRLAEDRITILISHRLSTARQADRIYVLAEGQIAEAGTHDELMDLGGLYAELFAAQAQHYQ
jgi:ATP-binding cassette, subfamily B, bacterial